MHDSPGSLDVSRPTIEVLALVILVSVGAGVSALAADGDTTTTVGPAPDGQGGGELVISHVPSLTDQQRQAIRSEIDLNVAELRARGELATSQDATVSFEWPLRAAADFGDFGYHGISGFVDHNPAFPDKRLDYNCGLRTYDLLTGYNHAGTDFFTWPFPWHKMDHDQVEVVAAAPGTIVYRQDGNYDRSCGLGGGPWNAIYVMHDDGSVAWYGHMKHGSLNPKAVGKRVETGERLGVVGSSGSSTGPHLHLEVYSSTGALIDPFAGPCNPTTPTSWWAQQRPYRDPAVNGLTTGTDAVDFGTCPEPAESNAETVFEPGTLIYFTTFYRDQVVHHDSRYSIYRPDGQLYNQWIHGSPATYNASYWYWYFFNFAPLGPFGWWRYEVEFEGRTYSHEFLVAPVLSAEIDVVPGDPTHSVKPRSRSTVAVAVGGNDELAAEDIDGATLRFGPGEAAPAHDLSDPAIFAEHLRDVNHDGQLDLLSHYRVPETGIRCGDDRARQVGFLLDGRPFRGTGSIRTVGCGLVPGYPVERSRRDRKGQISGMAPRE